MLGQRRSPADFCDFTTPAPGCGHRRRRRAQGRCGCGATAGVPNLPPGFANDRDQLLRATSSVVRNIAEAAGRWSKPDKAARFAVARGEAAEGGACVDILSASQVVDPQLAARVGDDLDRAAAMLTRLVQRNRAG